MKTEEICSLRVNGVPVRDLAEDNAHLYLWVTNNFLEDGLEVVKAWGFRYVTLITWPKTRFGLGQYFRGQTEHCMFCVRGVLPYRTKPDGKRAQGRTLLDPWLGEHSEKPEQMRQWIELVSHPPYIELFARYKAPGWEAWGNEVDKGRLGPLFNKELAAN